VLLSAAYKRVVFKIGSLDDTSARAINPQVSNQTILSELNDQLTMYANITKGIRDMYSFSLAPNVSFIEAPPLALRSKGYLFVYIITNGVIRPMDFRGIRDVYSTFTTTTSGITGWIMPWNAGHKQYLSGFPNNSTSILTTTLTADITADVTTIPVVSTAGQISHLGRLTIGDEKLMYEYKDATNFYGCTRGIEQTTAAVASSGDTVTQNNVIIQYARLPVSVELDDSYDNVIPDSLLDLELDPCNEHMEGIIKSTVYNLLLKIDIDRAAAYKTDAVLLYGIYSKDIEKGYAKNKQTVNIRDANSFGTSMLY